MSGICVPTPTLGSQLQTRRRGKPPFGTTNWASTKGETNFTGWQNYGKHKANSASTGGEVNPRRALIATQSAWMSSSPYVTPSPFASTTAAESGHVSKAFRSCCVHTGVWNDVASKRGNGIKLRADFPCAANSRVKKSGQQNWSTFPIVQVK